MTNDRAYDVLCHHFDFESTDMKELQQAVDQIAPIVDGLAVNDTPGNHDMLLALVWEAQATLENC